MSTRCDRKKPRSNAGSPKWPVSKSTIISPPLNTSRFLGLKSACTSDRPGLTTGYGPSHQATEDLAIFRGMPNLTIIDPCDAIDIEQATPAIANHPGPVYMRLLRGNVPIVLDRFSPILHLIQSIRDEAHRFAVTFHRTRRNAQRLTSELHKIPGVGERTVQKLLKSFGSLEMVRQAVESVTRA